MKSHPQILNIIVENRFEGLNKQFALNLFSKAHCLYCKFIEGSYIFAIIMAPTNNPNTFHFYSLLAGNPPASFFIQPLFTEVLDSAEYRIVLQVLLITNKR